MSDASDAEVHGGALNQPIRPQRVFCSRCSRQADTRTIRAKKKTPRQTQLFSSQKSFAAEIKLNVHNMC